MRGGKRNAAHQQPTNLTYIIHNQGDFLVELGMEGMFFGPRGVLYHCVVLFVKKRKRLSHSFSCFSKMP